MKNIWIWTLDVANTIADWLIARGDLNANFPIFTALYFHNKGQLLMTDAIYQ
jgi:integrase/recombinase XerC